MDTHKSARLRAYGFKAVRMTRVCGASSGGTLTLSHSKRPSKSWKQAPGADTGMSIILMYAIPAVVSLLCYLNSLHGDFVHDDIMAVTTNRDVLAKTSLLDLFRNDFWGKPMSDNTSHKSYRPLTIFTFRLNVFFGGFEPFGFHVCNALLHTMVVVLFANLCHQCLRWSSHVISLASLLMATHPIHTEAVSGIVGRADVLACALSLMSFLAYLRNLKLEEKSKATAGYNLSSSYFHIAFILALLAMLAKEHGVTVLGIIACYDTFLSEKKIRRAVYNWNNIYLCTTLLTRLTVTFLMTILLISFRIWILDGTVPQFSEQDNPTSFEPQWQTRFMTYSYLLAFNAWLLLGPITLSYDWQMGSISPIETVWDIRNLATVGFLITLLLLLCRALFSQEDGEKRTLCLGLLFIVLPFLPASNLFVTVGFVVAERILYFPSVGFCILVAHGVQKLLADKRWKRFVIGGIVVLIILFVLKTIRRNRVWSSREALFRSGLETLPHNAKMHYNYGNLQNDLGNVQEAIKHYKETLRLWPEHASAHNNLGTLVDDAVVAKFHFLEAIRINPIHARAHFNMGNLLSKEGQMPTAIHFMEQAVLLEPTYTDAYTNLAAMYSEVGRLEDAERIHKSLLQLEPDSADVRNNYGAFLQKIGRKDESLENYEHSIALQPDHLVALVNTAKLLKSMKKNLEAETLYKRALAIKEDPKIMDSLGMLYLSTGRFMEARKMFEELLGSFPKELDARVHFAQVMTHEQNFSDAEKTLRWVVARNSTHRDAFRHLALLCNHLNRTTEALGLILRALKLCDSSDVTCAQLYADHANILMDMDHMDLAAEAVAKTAFKLQPMTKALSKSIRVMSFWNESDRLSRPAENVLLPFPQSYKMALQVYPSFTLAHLNLGVIYHIKHNFDEAWKHYRTAQLLEPTNCLLQENMDKLRKAEVALLSMASSEHSDSCR